MLQCIDIPSEESGWSVEPEEEGSGVGTERRKKKQREGAQSSAHPGTCVWSSPSIEGAEKGMAKGFVR